VPANRRLARHQPGPDDPVAQKLRPVQSTVVVIMTTQADDDATFTDALQGLHRGDFSRLEGLFHERSGASGQPQIIEWLEQGRFREQPKALAEALTCASFLGRTSVAEHLLKQGVNPSGGAGTGLDALHWAANRGQLEAVRLLIRAKAPLETRSMYGGTAVGTAIWSAINEPRRDHLPIIEELLDAGARLDGLDYPTGNKDIDAILRQYLSR
jgi:ankyrin repeat protein